MTAQKQEPIPYDSILHNLSAEEELLIDNEEVVEKKQL